MEEENRKGPGIFYAVVGVATLVVAIIGATFAYFSASASNSENPITGQTADVGAAALSVSTTRYVWSNTGVNNDNLVPAVIDEATISGDATANGASIATALTNKCVGDGYTGCHVWKIVVNSTERIDVASVQLDLSVTLNDTASGHGSKANWKYALFTATDSAGTLSGPAYITTLESGTTAYGNLGSGLNDFELNAGTTAGTTAGLAAGTVDGTPSRVIYLMVFLDNVDQIQNDYSEGTSVNDTGSYSGTVTLDAGNSGQVVATFS